MYFRSSLRIITPIRCHLRLDATSRPYSILNNLYPNCQFLSASSPWSQPCRTFMFWRANVRRELYGSPTKALATKKRRRLQKSLTQIIREGNLWRLFLSLIHI